MAEPRHLNNAPIVEALIDVRAELPAGSRFENLDAFYGHVQDTYSIREVRTPWAARVQFSNDAPTVHTERTGPDGLILRTADRRRAVQARLDGFSASRLKPYENWAALRAEAERLWLVYRGVVAPTRVTRVTVRYINRIELPLPVGDLEDFFITRPEIPASVSRTVAGFLMRVVIPSDEFGVVGIVTQASEPATNESVSVLFDIEVFKEHGIDPLSADIWTEIDRLRDFKNRIFFDSVTERALERYL